MIAATSPTAMSARSLPVNAGKLDVKMAVLITKDPQPQVNIRADADTKYAVINDAVQTLRKAGVRKVGFVSGPERDQ